MPALFEALSGLNESERASAFGQLHGEAYATSAMNMVGMQQVFHRRLPSIWDRSRSTHREGVHLGQSEPMNLPSLPQDSGGSAFVLGGLNVTIGDVRRTHSRWTAFTGDWLDRQNVGAYSGYDMSSVGVIHASETKIGTNYFSGSAIAYDNVYQKFDAIQSDSRIDIFRLALYGGSRSGDSYSDSYIGYTRNWSKMRRHIEMPDFKGVARSRYTNNMFALGLDSKRDMRFVWFCLTPSIGMHYIHLSALRAKESGADDANLIANARSFDSVRFPMGAKLSHEFLFCCIVWRPEVRAFYIREVADASIQADTSFHKVREVPFVADSGKWGRNIGRFGAGLNAQLMDQLNFRIDYDYELYEYTSASAFGMTLGVRW